MSAALKARLIHRIKLRGHLTFAEFMEAALYEPELGFYESLPIGPGRHFITSPHVSPAFGALVGRQVAQVWELLDRPAELTVAEVGAGDGTLATQVLEAVRSVPDLARATRYVAVERSAGARGALESLDVPVLPSLADLDGPITGCVIANELLDNLPFHRLRRNGGEVVEVMVGAQDGRLVEVEAEPTEDALEALRTPLRPGHELPVSPSSALLVREIAGSLGRGYAFLFDYGFGPGEVPGPIHGYKDNRVLADVLDDPGSRDVTAAVDLEAVAGAAGDAGLTVWGPVGQREALLALGYRMWVSGLNARQGRAELAGDWREANRLFAERSKASILVDPAKLGGLKLVVFGTDGLPRPAAVLGAGRAGC